MESRPQNPELRNNPDNFAHVFDYIKYRSKDGTGQNLESSPGV